MYGLGYVQTQPGVSDHEIIAIDCEMVSFSKVYRCGKHL